MVMILSCHDSVCIRFDYGPSPLRSLRSLRLVLLAAVRDLAFEWTESLAGATSACARCSTLSDEKTYYPANDPKFCLLKTCLLLEFGGKTKAEVKKLAIDNYGNRVQIRDSQGRLTEGGRSFGAYNEIGLALHYETEAEAIRVASILRGEGPKHYR